MGLQTEGKPVVVPFKVCAVPWECRYCLFPTFTRALEGGCALHAVGLVAPAADPFFSSALLQGGVALSVASAPAPAPVPVPKPAAVPLPRAAPAATPAAASGTAAAAGGADDATTSTPTAASDLPPSSSSSSTPAAPTASSTPAPATMEAVDTSGSGGLSTGVIVGIAVGAVAMALLLAAIAAFLLTSRPRRSHSAKMSAASSIVDETPQGSPTKGSPIKGSPIKGSPTKQVCGMPALELPSGQRFHGARSTAVCVHPMDGATLPSCSVLLINRSLRSRPLIISPSLHRLAPSRTPPASSTSSSPLLRQGNRILAPGLQPSPCHPHVLVGAWMSIQAHRLYFVLILLLVR